MLADTGAQNSNMDGETYAKPLGLDLKTGLAASSATTQGTVNSYRHMMTMQIANLTPLTNVPIYFTEKRPVPYYNNIGWTGA